MRTAALRSDNEESRPVLSADEAAELLRISKWQLLQEIKRSDIPHKRVGRRVLFSRQRLMEWLDGNG